MTTNPYINNFSNSAEQNLLESLIIESIQFYGQDMYYVPLTRNNYDDIYGEDDQASYDTAYTLEMYIKSVDGFSGDSDFMSKFGIEIRNQVVFSMAQSRFNTVVGTNTTQVRPYEGDLIYFPLNDKCFEIKYVQKFEMFYPLGKLQTWEVTCELFEYSNETFNTGIQAIDEIQDKFTTDILNAALMSENEEYILTETGEYIVMDGYSVGDLIPADDTDEIQQESDAFIDFSVTDPFSEGNI